MNLSKLKILKMINELHTKWNSHNLEGVLELMHKDIIFENWKGVIVRGKINLQRSWVPWFLNLGNFNFIAEDIFVDEQEKKYCSVGHCNGHHLKNNLKINRRSDWGLMFFI